MSLMSFAVAAMLVWAGINVLSALRRLNRDYVLEPNRFLYPANCRPELCRDPGGFIAFITPRMAVFGAAALIVAALTVCNELLGLFAFLSPGLAGGVPLLLFAPLFVWYIVFINKAAKRFW